MLNFNTHTIETKKECYLICHGLPIELKVLQSIEQEARKEPTFIAYKISNRNTDKDNYNLTFLGDDVWIFRFILQWKLLIMCILNLQVKLILGLQYMFILDMLHCLQVW